MNILDKNRKKFERFVIDDNSELQIYTIHHTKTETWLGTSNGVFIFNRLTGISERFSYPLENLPRSRMVSKITSDKNGKIYIATHAGLLIYDKKSQDFKVFIKDKKNPGSHSNAITHVEVLNENEIWFGSLIGLSRLNLKTNKLSHFSTSYKNAIGLNVSHISYLFKDNEENLWIGTRDGLNMLSKFSLSIKQHTPEISPDINSDNIVDNIQELNDEILVYKRNGIFSYNLEKQIIEKTKLTTKINNNLPKGRVNTIKKDQNNNYWVGTEYGIIIFDENFRRVSEISRQNSNLDGNMITNLLVDSEDVWVGTYNNGLYKVNSETFTVKKISLNNKSKRNKRVNVNGLIFDTNKELWVSCWNGGLYKLDKQSETLMEFKSNSAKVHDFNQVNFEDVVEYKNDLWFASNIGVIQLNVDTLKTNIISKKNGLASNNILGLENENNKRIWITTNKGLSILNPETKLLVNYSSNDGIVNNGLSVNPVITKSNQLVTGGYNGLLEVPIKDISITDLKAKLKITDFFIKNQSIFLSNNDYTNLTPDTLKNIELAHFQVFFSIQFSSIQLTNQTQVKYAYKLEGWDKDWIYTDYKNRRATYTNIPAGDYTFKVKATNRDGIWNHEPTTLKITITPAPWKTWWAYSLYIIAFVSLVYFFFRQANKRKAAEEERKAALEISSTKDRLFANISHEFRTPLTLILSPLDNIIQHSDNNKDKDKLKLIKRSANRLLGMVDQMLDLSKLQGHKASERRPIDVLKTCRVIVESFESLSTELELNVRFKTNSDNNIFVSMVPDAFEKMIINLLSNAFKYTAKGGAVTLSIQSEQSNSNVVQISVADTGQGIDEKDQEKIFERFLRLEDTIHTAPGVGIGLALVKEIVDSHGANISVNSTPNKGSEFIISVPTIKLDNSDLPDSVQTSVSNDYINYSIETIDNKNIESDLQANSKQHDLSESRSSLSSILIVEDNQDLRNYLKEIFDGSYQIFEAADGDEGLTIAQAESPDLILSDVMMPKLNGFELTEKIRSSEAICHIPVILLTAKGDMESRIQGWRQTADDYITKPFDALDLQHRVANLLSIRKIISKRMSQGLFKDKDTPKSIHTSDSEEELLERNLNKLNEAFVGKINQSLEKLYKQQEVSVSDLAKSLAMSERQLFRKIKSTLDMSPSEYLRRYRLEKAKQLILSGMRPNEVAYEVGFTSQSYFGKCFRAEFGITPGAFIKRQLEN